MAIRQEILDQTFSEGKRLVDNHPAQKLIYDDDSQIKIVAAGRNFGKTILGILECLKYIMHNPESICYLVLPTYDMCEKIIWSDLLKILQFQNWKIKVNNNKKSVDILFNNSKIYLASADKSDRLRGLRIDYLFVDEYAMMKDATIWEQILEPCLTARGKALITSTPKGMDHFYKLWLLGIDGKDKRYRSWQFKSLDNVTDPIYNARVEKEKKLKDPKIFRQEHEASFESSSGKCSSDFSNLNILDLGIFKDKQIRFSCDFNVNPMCWIAFQIVPKSLIQNVDFQLQDEILYVLQEFKTPETNTQNQCSIIHSWLQQIKRSDDNYTWYGDSTGIAKDTTSVMDSDSGKLANDWDIIKSEFPNSFFKFNKSNGTQRNRINCLNAKILNSANEIGLIINPTCENLIADIYAVSWDADGKKIDKSLEKRNKMGHLYDALGYACLQEFQLRKKKVGFYLI